MISHKSSHNSLFLISLILLVFSGSALVAYASISDPVETAFVKDGVDGFDELDGIVETSTIVIGGNTYALVTAENNGALTIIDISNPATPVETSFVKDNVGEFDAGDLNDSLQVKTVVFGSTTYALVAASNTLTPDGLTIIDISTPATPSKTAVVKDGVNGFDELDGAFGVTIVVIDSITYVLVTSIDDGSLTIINIDTLVVSSGGGGSGDNKHKTRPTFGINHDTNVQQVEGGFSFNGVYHDITDNYWTEFAEQEVGIGELNYFTIKTFADKKLQDVEFLFGIPAVGEAHKAELGIEIHYDYGGEITEVRLVQESDVIDVNTLGISASESICASGDDTPRCITTVISVTFLEPLQHKIMALKAIDFERRSHTTYLNDGFDVTGYSLNPMKSLLIPGPEKYEGQIEVFQTHKYSNIWFSDDNRVFEQNDSGSFTQIDKAFERNNDSNKFDRDHSEFYKLYEYEIKRAVKQFNSNEIQSTLDDSISNEELISENYLVTLPKEHPEFYKIMDYEIKRALNQFNSNEIQADK